MASTFAILSLPIWKCPAPELMANMTSQMKTELWQVRMREIQGAIIVSSLFEVALGLFGIFNILIPIIQIMKERKQKKIIYSTAKQSIL